MRNDRILVEQTAIPESLCEREQWVCWKEETRDGKPTKIPVTPSSGEFASSTNPDTWGSLESALEYANTKNADGVGFVFTDGDPIVGVDLDDCRDSETGDINDDAIDIIGRLDSYTEISPSGTGYHVLVKGDLPDGRNRRGDIELYDTARFFTVTGDHVEDTPTHIARRQNALEAIHREYVQPTDHDGASESEYSGTADGQSEPTDTTDIDADLDDETLLKKAQTASNGPKFERLWNGNIGGYDSQSEADMALCCLLAFWTGGDPQQMDRLFRQSGLSREKWDEVHYADGSTYGEKTIERAIANTAEFYNPEPEDGTTQTHASSDEPSADAASDDSERNQAYLAEKNRLLADRVDELEATLERKNKRIETLETEVQRLKDGLKSDRQETADTQDADNGETGGATEGGSESLWRRTKQWLGSGSE